MGELLLNKNRFDVAIESFKAASKDPELRVDALFKLGECQIGAGKLADAIHTYEDVLAIKPSYAEVRAELCSAHFQNHDLERALSECRRAIRDKPSLGRAHYYLAFALNKKGNTDAAIKELEDAIRVQPEFPEAHYTLGQIHLGNKEKKKAEQEFKEAVRLRPDYDDALAALRSVESKSSTKAGP
jgi:tetratricopeptide (TPR) repeat protein